jgi:hypothetical protein
MLVVASRLNVADSKFRGQILHWLSQRRHRIVSSSRGFSTNETSSCLQIQNQLFLFYKQVRKTKRSIQITRRGKVIAEIRAIPAEKTERGSEALKGTRRVILSRQLLIWKILMCEGTKSTGIAISSPASYSGTQILIFRTETKIAAWSQRLCYVFYRNYNSVAARVS